MAAPVEATATDDDAYADLYEKFTYLQQQTNRLAAAYTLAIQDLEVLNGDNKILKDKLVQIRVRRRNLAAKAEATMCSNMTSKALFCRRNRRVLRKQFPLVTREQLSAIVDDEYESLPNEAAEQWQREFKTYVPKPGLKEEVVPRSSGAALPSSSLSTADITTPVKKAPAKPRRKPAKAAASGVPTEDVPKPKRATSKKKATEKAPAGERKPSAKKQRTSPPKAAPGARVAKRSTPTKSKGKAAPKDVLSVPMKKDGASVTGADDDDSSDSSNTNSSGNSSMPPSDDDSDDNLMHLPTGAFG
ncbi:hypothetical protein, variant [Aphanomyces invadans]|uniref:Uncharacterized protein n=1 Tax=Aphanomyces invadans TaxID=157072 RepID=A0A024U576_9STRA|nr:hypothetical protein, variant [Aphanomyces invadans]ETW01561.1 hypothetical protein, variant [Aphanomyces invadans]|eukprot:XP_008869409.1 hypothetical protein, variant [Aphanomyces invadans]